MKKKILKTAKFIDSYNNYYTFIANIIYKKIKNYDDAEEICQEVFALYFNQFENIQNPKYWLAKVANIKIMEFFRKTSSKSVDNSISDDSIAELISDKENDDSLNILIEELLANQDNIKSEEEKDILNQRFFEKSSYNKIAENIGLTPRQVKYKLEKIKARLLHSLYDIGINRIEDLL